VVTLAVIVILMSLLISVMRTGIKVVKQKGCVENLRFLSSVTKEYLVDHKQLYPSYIMADDVCIQWDDLLAGYDGRSMTEENMNSKRTLADSAEELREAPYYNEFYHCPEKDDVMQYKSAAFAMRRGYALTSSEGGGLIKTPSRESLGTGYSQSTLNISSPSATIEFVPTTRTQKDGYGTTMGNFSYTTMTRSTLLKKSDASFWVHGNAEDRITNYSFVDGHVEFLTLDEADETLWDATK